MADLEKVLGKTGAEKFWNKVWGNVKILTGDVAYKTKGDLQTQVTAAATAAATAKSTADTAKSTADSAKTAASTAQSQAANFGTAFSTTKAYAVGDYVIYGNKLYKFTTAHPAGAWNASHVTATTVAAELAAQNKNFDDELNDLKAYIKGGFTMTIGNVLYEAGTAATAVTKELETTSPSLIYLDHCASYTVTANGTDVNAKVISNQGSYNRSTAIAILPKGNISITFKGTNQTGAGCTVLELSL